MVIEDTTRVKDYLNKTKLTTLDYVINPYVGCPHKCLYCYASYMTSFSKHTEQWGDFVDVKHTNKKINIFKIKDKKVMISTVTDPYNFLKEKHRITRMILEQLVKSEAYISVVTKSKLVLRDIDILQKMKHVEVALSVSTLDEELAKKLEPCSSTIQERLGTLKELKASGIKTVLFISPVLPYLTDYKAVIEATKDYVDEYWFDKLSLRSSFKTKMFGFIDREYPEYKPFYNNIYAKKDNTFWNNLSSEIDEYCRLHNINNKIFFAGT